MKKFIYVFTFLCIFLNNAYSQNGGWFVQTSPVNTTLNSVSFINSSTGFISSGTKIIKTTNGGALWFIFDTSFNSSIAKVKFIDVNTGFVLSNDLYRTTNAGLSWVVNSSYCIDFGFEDSHNGWMKGGSGVAAYTTDCGDSWNIAGLNGTGCRGAMRYMSMGNSSFGAGADYFWDFMHGWIYMYICRSYDYGHNWYYVTSNIYNDPCAYDQVFDPQSWGERPLFRKSYIIDSTAGFLYGGYNAGTIYRTNDMGLGWTPISAGTIPANFCFVNHDTGYIAGTGVISYTTDLGNSWSNQATGSNAQFYDINMVNAWTGWAVGDSGVILKTVSGGLEIGLPSPPILISPTFSSEEVPINPFFDWSDVIMALNYWIQISTNPDFSVLIFDNNSLVQSQMQIQPILSYNTRYYWRVKTRNPNGWGDFQTPFYFNTQITAPLPPPELISPANGETGVPLMATLDWSDVSGAVKYRLQAATDTGFNDKVIDDSSSTISQYITPYGLFQKNTIYYWRVSVKNATTWGAFSNSRHFQTVNVPSPVELFNPLNFSYNEPFNITFIWYKPIETLFDKVHRFSSKTIENDIFLNQVKNTDNISAYWFELTTDTVSFAGILRDSTLTDTAKNIGNLAPVTDYYWRVRAKNSNGWGYFSSWWRFTTGNPQGQWGWYVVATGVGTNNTGIFFIDSQTGWICTNEGMGKVYKSSDGGINWIDVFDWVSQPRSICFSDPSHGEIASGPFPNGGALYPIWYTNDGGLGWNPIAYTNYYGASFTSVTYFNGNFWFCGELTPFGYPITAHSFIGPMNGETLFSNTIPLRRIRAGINNPWTVGDNGTVYRSTTPCPVGSSANLTGVSFRDVNTGYVVGGNYMYKSTDNGGSWTRIHPFSPDGSYNDVYFFNKDTGWVTCVLPNGVVGAMIYTTNGGVNWSVPYTGLSGSEFTFADNQNGWALSGNSVLKYGKLPFSPPLLLYPQNNETKISLNPTLNWSEVFGAVRYKVQLSTDSTFSTTIINDSSLTSSQFAISPGTLTVNTLYYWRVAAKDSSTWSSFSPIWRFRTLDIPAQIILYSPANNSGNQPLDIMFTWYRSSGTSRNTLTRVNMEPLLRNKPVLKSNVNDFNSYWFELVTDTGSGAGLYVDSTLTDTIKTLSGFSNSAKYYWRVKAKNEAGWGLFCSWWNFTTAAAAPSPPLLISPVNNATGMGLSLNLIWNKSFAATNYRVQVATDSLFTSLTVNDSTLVDSIKSITGLNPITYYWWRVNARNAGGISSYSSVWKFKTIGSPYSVNLISPANNSVNQPVSINFSWNNAVEQTNPAIKKSGFNKNRLALAPKSDGINNINNYWFELVTDTVTFANIIRDTTLTDTTKTVSGLNNMTGYFWRVKARNQAGWGSFSVWFKFTTIISAPLSPVLFSPQNNSIGRDISLNLIWNKCPGAVNYRVQVATDSLFNNLILNDSTLTDSTFLISGLTPLTNYWWRVNAKNIGGIGPFSEVWKFRTIGNPFSVILISPSNYSINQPISLTFIWNKAMEQTSPFSVITRNFGKKKNEIENVTNYWFELVTDTILLSNLLRDTTLTDTTKFVNGLSYLTAYYWRVKAKNQIGWGNYSLWFKFTTNPLPPAIVNLKVIPGGFFNPNIAQLDMRDTLRIILVDSLTGSIIDSARSIIDSVTFSVTPNLSFINAPSGNYYLYVYHRNHIPISSSYTIGILRGSTISYDFTDASGKTFGGNVIQVSAIPVRWGMIPGDANQDQYVDGLDQTIWIGQNGTEGYFSADFNGDRYVDGLDQTIWVENNGSGSILPYYIFTNVKHLYNSKNSQNVPNKNKKNMNIVPQKDNTKTKGKKSSTN